MQATLNKLFSFMESNDLQLDNDKTEVIVFWKQEAKLLKSSAQEKLRQS